MPIPETRAWQIVDKSNGVTCANGAYFRDEATAERVCEELKIKYGDPDFVVRMVTSPTSQLDPSDPVGCKCSEYPECTHVLYFYMGMKYAGTLNEKHGGV